jgi:uncharacterized protein YcnI
VRRSAGAAAALVSLAVAAPAGAHVIPQPAYLAPGPPTTITFYAPNERAPLKLVGLTVTAPAGVSFSAATPPTGWKLATAGRVARWTRDSAVPAGRDVAYRVVASTTLAPGAVSFRAVQSYEDGGVVRWNLGFTILPGAAPSPHEHLLPAFVTAVVGLAAIGLLLFRMRGRNPRSLRGH